MSKNNRTERISMRVRKDILEACDRICVENKYSRADVFEMGVLLMETNNDSDMVLQEKIYSEMVQRFEKLNDTVHEECENIQNNISSEIKHLKELKEGNEIDINKTEEELTDEVRNAVDEIITTISLREYELTFPKHTRRIFEPLGKEYYEFVAQKHRLPVNVILNELHERGYTDEYLLELGMNPLRRHITDKQISKTTIQ
ncbi:MAG: hypothetical protein J6V44_03745 [Methanobrevibacter sp.]|nr:hypothetical protein [Methanobrevibacter sp.]